MIRKTAILLIVGTLCLLNVNAVGMENNAISREPDKGFEPMGFGDTSGGGTHADWTLQWTCEYTEGLVVTDAYYRDQSVAKSIRVPWVGYYIFPMDDFEYRLFPAPYTSGDVKYPNLWSIWAYYTFDAYDVTWYVEINYVFYLDGYFRIVVTYHVEGPHSPGQVVFWRLPVYVDLDVMGTNNFAYELYDADSDAEAQLIWQEQITGMNDLRHPGLGPPDTMDGKFWVGYTGGSQSIVIKPDYVEQNRFREGHFIFVEYDPLFPWLNFYDSVDGDWWLHPQGTDLVYIEVHHEETPFDTVGSIISRHNCWNY